MRSQLLEHSVLEQQIQRLQQWHHHSVILTAGHEDALEGLAQEHDVVVVGCAGVLQLGAAKVEQSGR